MTMDYERFKKYLNERYHRRRKEALEALGKKCAKCGAVEDLQLDHVDRTNKAMDVADMQSYSDARFWAEVAKCQLLCRSCHQHKTVEDLGNQHAAHGSLTMYQHHGCRCDPCRLNYNAYSAAYRRRKRAEKKQAGVV